MGTARRGRGRGAAASGSGWKVIDEPPVTVP